MITHSALLIMNNYRSKFEAHFAKDLKKRKVPFEFETEKLGYILQKNYVPDFILHTKKGKKIYIETKGRLTQSDRQKMIAVQKNHPDKDIRLVFMRAKEKLAKNSKTTYAMWAERSGFKWADQFMPEEWLNE